MSHSDSARSYANYAGEKGVGESSIPWALRYTTSDMAQDVLELCDHIGWSGAHELHVVGVSMGGMRRVILNRQFNQSNRIDLQQA